MDIKVAKHKHIRTEPAYVFYVGRSNVKRYYGPDRCLTALGNPNPLRHEADREKVVQEYRAWLWNKVQAADPQVLRALQVLQDAYETHGRLVLVCHCAPLTCHADIIKACLEWRITCAS